MLIDTKVHLLVSMDLAEAALFRGTGLDNYNDIDPRFATKCTDDRVLDIGHFFPDLDRVAAEGRIRRSHQCWASPIGNCEVMQSEDSLLIVTAHGAKMYREIKLRNERSARESS